MQKRLAALGASVVLAVGGLAACSSGSDVVRTGAAGATAGAATSPAEALQRAADKTTGIDTAKVAMTLAVTGVPGVNDTTLTVDGSVDTSAHQSQFSFDLGKLAAALPGDQSGAIAGLLGDGSVQIVTDQGDVYVKLGSLASLLGATTNREWIKVSGGEEAAGAIGAPLGDGHEILQLLDQAGDVTQVGTESVRGVDTTHYKGTINVAAALANSSADERSKIEDELGKVGLDASAVSVPVDVWIDGDDLVRRVQIGVQGLAGTSESTTGNPGGTLTVELYDFGQPSGITVPPSDQVFEVDPSMLGSLAQLGGH